jgi:hypothetical protein
VQWVAYSQDGGARCRPTGRRTRSGLAGPAAAACLAFDSWDPPRPVPPPTGSASTAPPHPPRPPRARPRSSKVLMLDEATASVDVDTDSQIQDALRLQFGEVTCLTIAHRLNTIMDADRVIVMDSGIVVEDDEPATLLDRQHVSALSACLYGVCGFEVLGCEKGTDDDAEATDVPKRCSRRTKPCWRDEI